MAAGAVLLLYFFVEPKNGILPKCFFHVLTGLYCPGCGVQRSFHALLNGHILTAIDYNLLFILFLLLLWVKNILLHPLFISQCFHLRL